MAEQCKAFARSTGARCTQPAAKGQAVCRFHGGAAPRAKARAAERVLDAQLRATLARLDVAACDDPLAELSRLAGQVLAWRDALAERVNALVSVRYQAAGVGTEQLRAEVLLWERALDRCASVLGLIAKLDIDARMARISEQQAEVVVAAVGAALASAGVSGHAATEARMVAARHLRAVPG